MKLQIVSNEKHRIEGFKSYVLDENGEVDLVEVFTNECEEILLGDSINKIPLNKIEKFLTNVFSKLRKGGTVKLNFMNPRLLAMALCRDEMTLGDFNIALYSNKSLTDLDSIEAIVISNGLSIETCKLNGVGYDVTIIR